MTAAFAARRPGEVPPEAASTLPVAAGTAYDALTCLDLRSGSVLLVNGAAGGVGLALVQLAKARGIHVIGVASAGKHQILHDLGAVPVAYGDGVAERLQLAAPGGVDAIFDVVGGSALRSVASGVSRWGALISIGGDKQVALELGGAPLIRNRSSAVLTELAGAVAAQTLDPHVTDIRPFEDAAEALAAVEGGHTTGKVVLTFE